MTMICLAVSLSIGMVGCGQGGSSEPAASEDDGIPELTAEEEALEEAIGEDAGDEDDED